MDEHLVEVQASSFVFVVLVGESTSISFHPFFSVKLLKKVDS
jgi:hypothetical protein